MRVFWVCKSSIYRRVMTDAILTFQLLLDQRMRILFLQQIHMFRCLSFELNNVGYSYLRRWFPLYHLPGQEMLKYHKSSFFFFVHFLLVIRMSCMPRMIMWQTLHYLARYNVKGSSSSLLFFGLLAMFIFIICEVHVDTCKRVLKNVSTPLICARKESLFLNNISLVGGTQTKSFL